MVISVWHLNCFNFNVGFVFGIIRAIGCKFAGLSPDVEQTLGVIF